MLKSSHQILYIVAKGNIPLYNTDYPSHVAKL